MLTLPVCHMFQYVDLQGRFSGVGSTFLKFKQNSWDLVLCDVQKRRTISSFGDTNSHAQGMP
jgi:hypothetical protein